MGVTVLQACTQKVGVHRGALAAAAVAQYAMTADDLGRFPTAVEYAEWWAISERSAWRHRARIEDVFGESWPSVVELVADELRKKRVRSPRAAMRLQLDLTLA
jgi:hypothetical protein